MKWTTQKRKINELLPYEHNPRQLTDKQHKDLLASLKKFDLVEIPAINTDNTILAGHQRLTILKALGRGDEEIDVRVPDRELNEQELQEYNIRSNKNTGEWDWDKLANNFDVGELLEWGFDEKELKIEREIEEDEAPEVSDEEPISKYGEVYQLGRHRLMCGDATKIEDVEKLMNGQKADMVFTDPPYGINVVKNDMVGADFGVADKGKYSPVINDKTIQTAQDAYNLFVTLNILKIILWGGNYFLSFLPPSDGWLIWDKRGDTGIKNTFADGEMAWCNFHTPIRIYKQLWNGMIREGESEKRVHPTQKPIKVLSDIIKDFSKANDIILDTFGGSGSTLIACEQTVRTCYMMELDPKYCDVIRKRYAKFINKEA